jgi:GTPase involved in cell partitioning and DNA repair
MENYLVEPSGIDQLQININALGGQGAMSYQANMHVSVGSPTFGLGSKAELKIRAW